MYGNTKDQQQPKQCAERRSKLEASHPDFKLHCTATAIKPALDWHKERSSGQQNRKENPEIHPPLYGQLNYNEGGKNHNREKTASSINGVGKSA